MGFNECPPPELLADADPAPAPCGPCAEALLAPSDTLNIASATTRTSFFICPSESLSQAQLAGPGRVPTLSRPRGPEGSEGLEGKYSPNRSRCPFGQCLQGPFRLASRRQTSAAFFLNGVLW